MRFFLLGLLALGAAARVFAQADLRDETTPEELADPDFFKNNRSVQLLEWRDPVCPPEVIAEGKVVFARVRVLIEPDGQPAKVRTIAGNDERYGAAVVEAVKQWKFSAETRRGKPVAAGREIQFRFDPTQPPPKRRDPKKSGSVPYQLESAAFQDAIARHCPDPVYPKALEPRRLIGSVEMNLEITKEGRVGRTQVVRSSYAEFTQAALRTVAGWEFIPAGNGDVPTKGVKNTVLDFTIVDPDTGKAQRAEWLARNGIVLIDPPDTKTSDYFDHMPEALFIVDPVYPYELAREGVAGAARVNFTVDRTGQVKDVMIAEATEPRFGEALAAAISAWVFEPMRRGGEKTTATFAITRRFSVPALDAAETRLLELEAGTKVLGPQQLDRKLVPIYRVAPAYPDSLRADRVAGEAEIEIFIDRDGRVRWPRVKGASRPELGWAAATAAAQWFFEVPRKGGEPVDTRVVIPFQFTPTE